MKKIYLISQEMAKTLVMNFEKSSPKIREILKDLEDKLSEAKDDKSFLVESETELCNVRKFVGDYGRKIKPSIEYLQEHPEKRLMNSEEFQKLVAMNSEAIELYKICGELIKKYRVIIDIYNINHATYGPVDFMEILDRIFDDPQKRK